MAGAYLNAANGFLFLFCFQYFFHPRLPSSSHGAVLISFPFNFLRTLSLSTGGYTHPPLRLFLPGLALFTRMFVRTAKEDSTQLEGRHGKYRVGWTGWPIDE